MIFKTQGYKFDGKSDNFEQRSRETPKKVIFLTLPEISVESRSVCVSVVWKCITLSLTY